MGLLNRNQAACRECRAQLEETASAARGVTNLSDLLAAAPASAAHVKACAACRAAAEDLLATRVMLSALPSNAGLGGPWFASRVMAAIAARKAELARTADTWTFLPRLAARLTWVSSVALLLASAWIYQRPLSKPPIAAKQLMATDITGEPMVDTAASIANDDVLASLAEKPR